MNDDALWQTKLHARLHDPAEKALVLLRDPAGHEGGTSRVLWRMARAEEVPAEGMLDNDNADVLHAVAFAGGIKPKTYKTVQRADWWAAAADRPQWPLREIDVRTRKGEDKTIAVADFAQVRWAQRPELIHPLTGERYDLGQHGGLSDTDVGDLKQRSFDHFAHLLVRNDGATDFRKSALAFWRFGPEVREDDDFGKLGALWRLLPADTRVPDHSIWDHLDLTSAFAGAFAADLNGEAALLSLSIGPVQSFIEAARTTSDLWAGSHLLARLAWEAMKPVCEQLGPDAILFPRLRGVPQVDLWLRDTVGLPREWFASCDWNKPGTDANPLFSAALPNRFVAVVPASRAKKIATQVEQAVRGYLQKLGQTVVNRLLAEAGLGVDSEQHCHAQMRDQLAGFPEVHWAVVPFSLIRCRDQAKQRDLDVSALSAAMRPFFDAPGEPGFLSSPAWQVLQKDTAWDDRTTFFAPNPGVLYPAVYDLAERVMAAAKTARPFAQTQAEGWRCSLTGETEWLCTHEEQRHWNQNYRKQRGTLWTEIAKKKPAWAKKGEHLGALPAIKRLWPTLFAEEVRAAVGGDMQRFVVSTHTMALAGQMENWLGDGASVSQTTRVLMSKADSVALPRKLLRLAPAGSREAAKALPALLDAARELRETAFESPHQAQAAELQAKAMENAVRQTLGRDGEPARLETYYALLLMDGDRMGAWLSGGENYAISYRDSFHSKVRDGAQAHVEKHEDLRKYFNSKRALSPNRHLAISGALNDFSLTLARFVVEDEHAGRLIYSGGDDVLAMLPVMDLLAAMQQLRAAYSGVACPDAPFERARDIEMNQGFVRLTQRDGEGRAVPRLMRLMGSRATASIGAVIAHHQAPLGAVMRELRSAEKRAKNEGGRDAFSLTVIKRSGGDLRLTAKLTAAAGESPMTCLRELSAALRQDVGASRRAAYRIQEWLPDMPEPTQVGGAEPFRQMLASLLAQTFRHADKKIENIEMHVERLVSLCPTDSAKDAARFLGNFLSVAEFLARETRSASQAGGRT